MLASLALCTLLQSPALGAGELTLANPRLTYGALGPVRPDASVRPGDSVHLAFDIQGISTDNTGKASYSTAVEVMNAAGVSIFKQTPRKYHEFLALGGNSTPADAEINLGPDSPAGKYTLHVTVTDTTTMKSATVTQAVTVDPKRFDIVRVSLTGDAEGQVPTGAFVVGQPLWVHAAVVDFARAQTGTKQPKVEVTLSVLGANGQPLAQPFVGQVEKDVPANATSIPVRFFVPLNKAGNYTVQLTAADAVGKGSAKLTFPLTVVAAK